MLERQREGIAKAKALGRYKGRVPTVRRQADEIIRLKRRRQPLGNRQQAGDWTGQRLSGAGHANRQRSDGPSPPRCSTQATWKEL